MNSLKYAFNTARRKCKLKWKIQAFIDSLIYSVSEKEKAAIEKMSPIEAARAWRKLNHWEWMPEFGEEESRDREFRRLNGRRTQIMEYIENRIGYKTISYVGNVIDGDMPREDFHNFYYGRDNIVMQANTYTGDIYEEIKSPE